MIYVRFSQTKLWKPRTSLWCERNATSKIAVQLELSFQPLYSMCSTCESAAHSRSIVIQRIQGKSEGVTGVCQTTKYLA
jgi:hypothetical protein